jgi:uncharacterized CHY-type Zn-finger protein
MSTYFSVYRCQDCAHEVPVGFVGEQNFGRIFCAACHDSFVLSPEAGQRYLQNALPHKLMTIGKKDAIVFSKKGRIKKHIKLRDWVETGVTVPIHEDVVQSGEKLYLTYQPIWEPVACPACGLSNTLMEYRDYLKTCPACGGGKMLESEL